VRVSLALEGGGLEAAPDAVAERTVRVDSHGEARVDWPVRAVREGNATIRIVAVADSESDAVQMDYPVHVHGMLKTESWSAAIRPDGDSVTIAYTVPAGRRPDQSRLEVRW